MNRGVDGRFCKTHGMYGTRLQKIWIGIKNRCTNKNNQAYSLYGGRGIKCARDTFESFYSDMSDSYIEGLSVDRIDSNEDYCKSNCRRATMKEQNNNRRNNHIIEYNGHRLTMKQWSERLGINYRTLSTRINRDGRTIEWSLNPNISHRYKKI